uniref:mannosyl-oligosaccharide 1,3-1,6-alpha-mannosidase n=2 Tax=Mesocestoides corti TaxID=53468 RepID=A0A5K3EJC2_MESCO
MTPKEYFDKFTHQSLDATVDFLGKNPSLRFIYAEVVYLDMWWQNLSLSVRTLFTKLVREGQWEVATGGWVMNDEATTHYAAIISQLIEGQHWLLDNLGFLPNVSWAIDAFGHSTSEAYLLRKIGIKNILIHRVHYEVKRALAKKQSLEFYWRQPWDSTGHTEVFTHVMPFYSYDIPHTCGPDPSICCQFDFLRIKLGCPWGKPPIVVSELNIQERVKVLVDQYRKKAKLFNNNGVLLVPLGDDFRYLTTDEWSLQMSNYQLLIDHINAEPSYKMHIRFGTLSEYFNLVHSRKESEGFPTFRGDFFTYSDLNRDYWSGYYTSRPSHKAMSRYLEAELRTAEILFSFARSWNVPRGKPENVFLELFKALTLARRSLALFQHHDGITGTSKSYVMADFHEKLEQALLHAHVISATSAAFLLGFESTEVITAIEKQVSEGGQPVMLSANRHWGAESTSKLFNISFDNFDVEKTFFIFNQLSRTRDQIFVVNVDLTKLLRVAKQQSTTQPQVLSLLVCLDDGTALPPVQLEPSSLHMSGDSAFLFRLSAGPIRLTPLQIVKVTVKASTKASTTPAILLTKPTLYNIVGVPPSAALFYAQRDVESMAPKLESDFLELKFNAETGLSQVLRNKKTGYSHRIDIGFELVQTAAALGKSGAYLGSNQNSPVPLAQSGSAQMRLLRGAVTEELTTYYSQLEHTIRLYRTGTPSQLAMEIENLVDLTKGHENMELVMTIKTDIQNTDRHFFTDSNCLQMTRRKYHPKIPASGNIYPMTCALYIEDSEHRVSLLSAQSLGVTAGERPGEMRVWLERKMMYDDWRGMEEAMEDAKPSRSLFRVIVEDIVKHQADPDASVPNLTGEAHYVLSDLNNPAAQFLANFDPKHFAADRQLMSPLSLHCDYDLVTMKAFFSQSERYKGLSHASGSQVGLVLHRSLHACGTTHLCEEACECSGSLQINIKEIFPNTVFDSALKTPLNLIPERTAVISDALTEISVPPMELDAFLLISRGNADDSGKKLQ